MTATTGTGSAAGPGTAPTPFALLGPLPTGTTVLEASAGTGKTFTIAALVARYVAEGVATMDQLLVVSFSRESTRELRERVRERLVDARDYLADRIADSTTARSGDDVLRHLGDTDPDGQRFRCRRLEDALAVFDAATVTTTHGFCQQVLLALGTAGDHDPGAMLVENIGDIVREVADDLYVRKWGGPGSEPAELTRDEFHQLALAVATDPATDLLPELDVEGLPGLRARIAHAIRAEVDVRKRRQRLIDYDDMLLRLRDTLIAEGTGEVACGRLRDRYQVVLVDEFQDTDPVQWTILREAFHRQRTLVLIGDPKQSIYGFRGADVHAYLEAKDTADTVHTLPINWRSDAPLLTGMAAVLGDAALGDPRIRVLPVTAAHDERLIDGLPPVRLRVVPRAGLDLTNKGLVRAGEARDVIARDVAAQVVSLLTGDARLHPRDKGNTIYDRVARRLEPGDIAVLVRNNKQATLVQSRLQEAGVPVVLTGKTSVFATAAAAEWQLLLEALEQPHRTTRVRRFALSCFVGSTATELDTLGDGFADDLALRLRRWGKVFEQRSVAALFEAVCLSEAVQPRVLSRLGGERLLTDLRHIAQSLHAATLEGQLGLTALLAWLRRRRDEAAGEGGLERSRRLESDAAAVQVITVHTSKGLEFPVVLVPFASDKWAPEPVTAVFHDDRGRRVRDIGGAGSPGWADHVRAHQQEDVDDELRLTYVAVTRAQSHLVLWWAPTTNTAQSPLQRLLCHDDPGVVAPLSIPVPDDPTALAVFEARAAVSNGGLEIAVVSDQPPTAWKPGGAATPELSLATFNRPLDLAWRRTSYSSLTSAAHEQTASLGSEPEVAQQDDETDLDEGVAGDSGGPDAALPDAALLDAASVWDGLPGGAAFGTLVHGVLEELAGPATDDGIRAVVATQVARYAPGTDVDLLSQALAASLATPLGPLADDVSLRDLPLADRLNELDFELPLVGGDEPRGATVLLDALMPLWRAHCPTGPISRYADVLADLAPAPLRGYLTGSIDAVLRIGPPEHHRYLVVDYKTNRLGGHDEPLTAWHYRPATLAPTMVEAHYPLQALLYNVALHRYLRWRQPGYIPEQHLGGVLYLFLRGMTGPELRCADGSVPGVFSWRPPTALVTELSDLLAGRR